MNAYSKLILAATTGLAAMTVSAQWTSQLLNDYAVTNELGEMVVLWDEGGYYNQENNTDCAPWQVFNLTDNSRFFDALINDGWGGWVGFELQSPKLITRVRYTGRGSWGHRTTGTLIQGANLLDFSDAVTLWTLPAPPANWNPPNDWLTETFLTTNAFQSFTFVRFYCPLPGSYGGNFSRMEFYGADPLPPEAPAPTAPTLAFAGSINWRMNLLWNASPNTDPNATLFEIQRKIANEDDFSPLTFVYAQNGMQHHMDGTLKLYQDTEYRIRGLSSSGESAWTTVMGETRNAATGQWIGMPGTYGNGMTGDKVFDGNVLTFFDAPNSSDGNDCWTGLDFGSEKPLIAIRFVPRRDFPNRMPDGWFEVADNPDFINPTTVYAVPNNATPPINMVTEVNIAPVMARYARYCSRNGTTADAGWGNVAEVEFVMPPAPLPPASLTITSSDFTNQHAVLAWNVRDVGAIISSTLVYRATSPGGPYALLTPDGIGAAMTWTDTSLIPGITYYYNITSLLNASPDPLESGPSAYTAYRPFMWVERDPATFTQIKPGMALIGAGNPWLHDPANDVQAMFDGNLNSYVDVDNFNPAVGVDLGKPHCIQFMRHAARGGNTRLEGAELRGSNDPNYTGTYTVLATFANTASGRLVTQQTLNQEPFRYIYIQRPDSSEFYGNISELELYGWDPDACANVLKAPATVTLSILPAGVGLDWETDTAQDAYRIQRSTDGINWTDLGDTPGAPFTDTAPLIAQRALYRIAAVRGTPEELAFSDTYPVIAYAPGTGTGLTANYYTDFFLGYNTSEAFAGSFLEPTPDWYAGAAVPIRPDIPNSAENIRIVWHANLTIPFDGDWTLYLTSDDGAALRIDDVFVINAWRGRGSTTDQVTLPLKAGKHTLRMDYFNGGGGRAMKLEWGGAVERTVIPTVQFEPLPPPPEDGVFRTTGEWQGRTFNAQILGHHTLNPDGSITIGSSGGDLSGGSENHHYVWQTLHGDFTFEAQVDMDIDPLRSDGKAMLMVRNALPAGSPFLALCAISAPSGTPPGKFNVKHRIPPATNVSDAFNFWTGPDLPSFHLRVKRLKGTFSFAYRETAPGSPWVTIHTFEDTDNTFGKDLYAGLAVCAPTQGSQNMFQTATFSNIRFTRLGTGSLIILK